MTGPVIGDPDSATLPRLLSDSETAELIDLWGEAVVGRATADLHKAGMEAAGNRTPGVAHVLIRNAKGCDGASLVLTLVSDGTWLARPPLDYERVEKLLNRAACQITDVADHILEDKRLHRAALDHKLMDISRALLDEMQNIDDANPDGIFASWLPITAEDAPDMWGFASLVWPLPAKGGK